jgi:DNA polymerase-3 subunit epsilon
MRKTLPTFYYLDHFHEFLKYFRGDNQHMLTPTASDFIQGFLTLDKIQQALLVRIANRKQTVISYQSLEYIEIPDVEQQIHHLIANDWLAPIHTAPPRNIA